MYFICLCINPRWKVGLSLLMKLATDGLTVGSVSPGRSLQSLRADGQLAAAARAAPSPVVWAERRDSRSCLRAGAAERQSLHL